jgi:hypothetical protein
MNWMEVAAPQSSGCHRHLSCAALARARNEDEGRRRGREGYGAPLQAAYRPGRLVVPSGMAVSAAFMTI